MISLPSFKIVKGDLISLIGSGGKTTLMYKLAREATRMGMKVISTTTTHMYVPTPGQTEKFILLRQIQGGMMVGQPSPVDEYERIKTSSPSSYSQTPLFDYLKAQFHQYSHITLAQDYVEDRKVKGLPPDLICEIYAQNLADLILVEADGARQKLFKAPKDHEPVVPSCSSGCILVVNLAVIGKPLDERYVHRIQLVSEITGLTPGETLTPQAICEVINNPKTYRNKIPPSARRILFLNGIQTLKNQSWAEEVKARVDPEFIQEIVGGD
ncbi:MAG TPA: selenium cofactor biosynthesis protein YqeC [Candidatus Limnocylindrales bacterium]|nr:selenium cofactor biosynthesis protein YqeC [Candidatus Limnocylindrales bacterium]